MNKYIMFSAHWKAGIILKFNICKGIYFVYLRTTIHHIPLDCDLFTLNDKRMHITLLKQVVFYRYSIKYIGGNGMVFIHIVSVVDHIYL